MLNSVNTKHFKTIENYSTKIKKSAPISMLTTENTIFIKTNQNKLTSNYLINGNQIRHNKNHLSTIINHSRTINKSLKNSNLIKSVNVDILDNKDFKNINQKINEIINNKNIQNIHYRGTNSFIKMGRRSKNNLSSVNSINANSLNNHLFNFYGINNKLNNSSVKGKPKVRNKLEKYKDNKITNENDYKNFNSTYTMEAKTSTLKRSNNKEKANLNYKKIDPNINRTTYFKKFNNSNNLSNLIKSSNHDNLYYRTIDSYQDKEKEKDKIINKMKRQFYYTKRNRNNKYISSVERKKEKSLAERRQRAKKPISYLMKNNLIDLMNNLKNDDNSRINLNNLYNKVPKEKIGIKKIEVKEQKIKNKEFKKINYKKNIYDLHSYNYNLTLDNEDNAKKTKTIEVGSIEYNNKFTTNKTSSSTQKRLLKIKKENNSKNDLQKNNNIVNNNYFNINNTFIFDTVGTKLNPQDLRKLMNENKNSTNINYTEINDYSSNVYKTVEASDLRNKNHIIKNLNNFFKKDNKSKIIKKNNNNYINILITDKNYINNKTNIPKLSKNKISLIKTNIDKNYFHIISTTDNNNIQSKNKTKNNYKTLKISHNEDKIINNLNLNNKKIIKKNSNNNNIYNKITKQKKTENKENISKNTKLDKFNSIINTCMNNTTNNSIQKEKKIRKDITKGKNEFNNINLNIRKNKIMFYKIMSNKNKNKSYSKQKLTQFKIKEDELFEPNKNNVDKIPKIAEGDIKNKYINNFDNNRIYNEHENNNYANKNSFIEIDDEDMILEKDLLNKKQNSFELISISDNENENNKINKEEEKEDNFDDLNTIIQKINFNDKQIVNNDIFSLNDKKYKEYSKKFDNRFHKWIKNE